MKQKEVFIACSGGVDSMVLTHLVKQFNPRITLLHVNYNLRGEDSQEDENFVRNYASRGHLSFQSYSVHLETKRNLQGNARKIRYEWFTGQIQPENAVLLLAHHGDDQLETFYLNLARKSGNAGMACMPEIHGKIIRPLLSHSKAEIYDFARKNRLIWREDSSNRENEYTRNRLRNELLPSLEKKIPGLRNSVFTLIGVFQENKKMVEASVELLVADIRENQILELSVWNGLTVEQRISILKSFGYTPRQLTEIQKLEKAEKGKSVSSNGYKIIREKNHFYFEPPDISTVEPKLFVETVQNLPASFSKQEIYLDAAKISGKLHLRKWKTGDRISPIGMKGSQLVSDVITDSNIPHTKRKDVLVVVDDQIIHWCADLKIGRLALADESTKIILRIRITN
ncbi:MAG: tRNA lysidine(34) synthetase TilS [Bacteroidota bacterium]